MSLPEVTPARLADHELEAMYAAWVVVEVHAENADNWRRHTGATTMMAWRTPDHVRLTRLLAHIAWQAAEMDRLTVERNRFWQIAMGRGGGEPEEEDADA